METRGPSGRSQRMTASRAPRGLDVFRRLPVSISSQRESRMVQAAAPRLGPLLSGISKARKPGKAKPNSKGPFTPRINHRAAGVIYRLWWRSICSAALAPCLGSRRQAVTVGEASMTPAAWSWEQEHGFFGPKDPHGLMHNHRKRTHSFRTVKIPPSRDILAKRRSRCLDTSRPMDDGGFSLHR